VVGQTEVVAEEVAVVVVVGEMGLENFEVCEGIFLGRAFPPKTPGKLSPGTQTTKNLPGGVFIVCALLFVLYNQRLR